LTIVDPAVASGAFIVEVRAWQTLDLPIGAHRAKKRQVIL
jgi:hypothetical protein